MAHGGAAVTARFEIEVLNGESQGERVRLAPGAYCVVVRAESQLDATMQLAAGGDRLLNSQAVGLAEQHIRTRGASHGHRLQLRERSADLSLDDGGISRTHAILFHGEQGLSVVDLMSTNGTLVNGQLVQDADLAAGDIVRVGDTELMVRRSL
ncbi:MAG: FHA domain-containing protein [Pseudomonadota bacterium]